MSDTNTLDALIQSLRRLPGVGVKSAQRVAQLCVVSKRGEKPSGNFAAHRRAATGSSWA